MFRLMSEFRSYRLPMIQFLCGCARFRRTFAEGEVKDGFTVGGQVVGRIEDIPTCRELILRIVKEAEVVILALNGTVVHDAMEDGNLN